MQWFGTERPRSSSCVPLQCSWPLSPAAILGGLPFFFNQVGQSLHVFMQDYSMDIRLCPSRAENVNAMYLFGAWRVMIATVHDYFSPCSSNIWSKFPQNFLLVIINADFTTRWQYFHTFATGSAIRRQHLLFRKTATVQDKAYSVHSEEKNNQGGNAITEHWFIDMRCPVSISNLD